MTLHFVDTEPGPTTTDLGTSVVRLGSITGLTTQAEAGTTPTSSIEIDDPAGSLNFIGLWRFYVTETACPAGKQMLWNGYKRARRVRRGDAKRGSLRTGAARMWTVDLVDVNSLLDRDIIQGAADAAHGKRPAETDVARITWLLSSSFMNHIHDNGLFSTAAPLSMDACDYRGQYGGDVLRDCSVQSGKNFYAYYDEASAQDSLFYDDPNSAAYDSGKFLSNVLSEIDNSTTFGLLDDWELARDPSKVYAGALVPYSGGSTYRYSAAVAAAFYTRDGTAPNPNISTLAAAQAAGDRFIADSATEDDRLTGRVKIPAAHVNDIYAGMLVEFKASHLPGYETGHKCRVITRSVAQDEESDQFYNVHFELSPINMPPAVDWFVGQASGGFPEGSSSLWASDDNVTFHQVLSAADMATYNVGCLGNNTVAPIPSGERRHRYWRLQYQGTEYCNGTAGLRYYGGVDYRNCWLLSGTVTGLDSFCTPVGTYTNVWAGIPFTTTLAQTGMTSGGTSFAGPSNPSFTPGVFGLNPCVFGMTATDNVVITATWTVKLPIS